MISKFLYVSFKKMSAARKGAGVNWRYNHFKKWKKYSELNIMLKHLLFKVILS